MNDIPQPRVTDTEREQALLELTQHLSVGRLDVAEFDERSAAAAAASTRAQLAMLFADLPADPPTASPQRAADWLPARAALSMTLLIGPILAFIIGGWPGLCAAAGVVGSGLLVVLAIRARRGRYHRDLGRT
ncbi:DUF1707 SHOCT-like domain-containing protein [Nocardia iowensis]|uniref:DUF1707 domain-containing protein n=1 Tax=Nocardia iowensis TaxID=204891 RepID=A0ABX8RYG5_NOCIO|nr:DUF1707 domain-containing protein [Nocardia iowensis]QXN94687.1 DUF1707 domain-containing protein [Nocardia iowensis]